MVGSPHNPHDTALLAAELGPSKQGLPAKTKRPKDEAGSGRPAKRAKPKLSFDDEVEDDMSAPQAFSLAASTVRKWAFSQPTLCHTLQHMHAFAACCEQAAKSSARCTTWIHLRMLCLLESLILPTPFVMLSLLTQTACSFPILLSSCPMRTATAACLAISRICICPRLCSAWLKWLQELACGSTANEWSNKFAHDETLTG